MSVVKQKRKNGLLFTTLIPRKEEAHRYGFTPYGRAVHNFKFCDGLGLIVQVRPGP